LNPIAGLQTQASFTDTPGYAVVRPSSTSQAPKFFISPRDSQLYQAVNSTTVFPVTLRNITDSSVVSPEAHESPLALAFGTSRAPLRVAIDVDGRKSVSTGTWRWQGPMLVYETDTATVAHGHVRGSNDGL
jgi:hypothetical protein